MHITSMIHHRVNTIAGLALTSELNGVEIDIRYHNDEIILHHDPFGHQNGNPTSLSEFCTNYKNKGPLILNLKTEGVEDRCIKIMNDFNIKNWFFLDMSPPYFVKYAQRAALRSMDNFGPENLAVRFSENEPIEYALAFKDQVKWLWVDCFTKLPLDDSNFELLKRHFKICLVSPELQGHSIDRIKEFKDQLQGKTVDAVCSKRLDLW